MQNILSSKHCARITTCDGDRRQLQNSKMLSNWMKMVGFIAFNLTIWFVFLAPMMSKL